MVRVLVIDNSARTLANIERQLDAAEDLELCGTARDGATGVNSAHDLQPDVVLIDMELPHRDGLRAAQTISQHVPAPTVVVMGIDDDDSTLQRVADSGARDYLIKPFGADELLATVRKVVAAKGAATRGSAVRGGPRLATVRNVVAAKGAATGVLAAPGATEPTEQPVAPSPSPEPEPQPAAPITVAVPPPNPDQQVVVVVSGKGGAGTSVIACNLALLVANETRRRVAIVDLDLQHGDVRRMLRLDAPEGIMEVARSSPSADRKALIPRLVDGPANVMALLPPPLPAIDAVVSPEFAHALLLQLRSLADIVIVDLPSHITPAGLAAMLAADRVVLVSSMSDPGVRATQGMLRFMAAVGVDSMKVVVALNRNEANSDLTKASVEEALGRSVPVQLPYDAILVSTSINRGAPFVLQKPDTQVSRRVRELASLICPMPAGREPSAETARERVADARFEDTPRKTKKKGLFSRGKN